MIGDARQDFHVTANSTSPFVDAAALASADGRNVTVRFVNRYNVTAFVSLSLPQAFNGPLTTAVTTLVAPNGNASAVNPARDPFLVTPQRSMLQFHPLEDKIQLAPVSFTTVTFQL